MESDLALDIKQKCVNQGILFHFNHGVIAVRGAKFAKYSDLRPEITRSVVRLADNFPSIVAAGGGDTSEGSAAPVPMPSTMTEELQMIANTIEREETTAEALNRKHAAMFASEIFLKLCSFLDRNKPALPLAAQPMYMACVQTIVQRLSIKPALDTILLKCLVEEVHTAVIEQVDLQFSALLLEICQLFKETCEWPPQLMNLAKDLSEFKALICMRSKLMFEVAFVCSLSLPAMPTEIASKVQLATTKYRSSDAIDAVALGIVDASAAPGRMVDLWVRLFSEVPGSTLGNVLSAIPLVDINPDIKQLPTLEASLEEAPAKKARATEATDATKKNNAEEGKQVEDAKVGAAESVQAELNDEAEAEVQSSLSIQELNTFNLELSHSSLPSHVLSVPWMFYARSALQALLAKRFADEISSESGGSQVIVDVATRKSVPIINIQDVNLDKWHEQDIALMMFGTLSFIPSRCAYEAGKLFDVPLYLSTSAYSSVSSEIVVPAALVPPLIGKKDVEANLIVTRSQMSFYVKSGVIFEEGQAVGDKDGMMEGMHRQLVQL